MDKHNALQQLISQSHNPQFEHFQYLLEKAKENKLLKLRKYQYEQCIDSETTDYEETLIINKAKQKSRLVNCQRQQVITLREDFELLKGYYVNQIFLSWNNPYYFRIYFLLKLSEINLVVIANYCKRFSNILNEWYMIVDVNKNSVKIESIWDEQIPFYEQNYIKQVCFFLDQKEQSKINLQEEFSSDSYLNSCQLDSEYEQQRQLNRFLLQRLRKHQDVNKTANQFIIMENQSSIDISLMTLINDFREITNDREFVDAHVLYMLRERNYDVNALVNAYFNQKQTLISNGFFNKKKNNISKIWLPHKEQSQEKLIQEVQEEIQENIIHKNIEEITNELSIVKEDQNFFLLGQEIMDFHSIHEYNLDINESFIIHYQVTKHKQIQNLPKNLKGASKKNSLGSVRLYICSPVCPQQQLEFGRLSVLEEFVFDLLLENKMKLFIQVKEQSAKRSYEFKILIKYFLRFDQLSSPLDQIRKNFSQQNIQFIYHLLKKQQIQINDPLKIQDDQLDLVLKQKFYNQIGNIKQKYKDREIVLNECRVSLLRYQQIGLIWMIDWETNQKISQNEDEEEDINPLWEEFKIPIEVFQEEEKFKEKILIQNKKNKKLEKEMFIYYNRISGQLTLQFPKFDLIGNLKGGILADEMGLGKTIQLLSLIQYSKENENHFQQLANCPTKKEIEKPKRNSIDQMFKSNKKEKSIESFGKNLIVVPAVLIDQWTQQTQKFFPQLSIFQYTSQKGRWNLSKEDLTWYDIIIISYDMMRSEYSHSKGNHGIYSIKWLRVILDEANQIQRHQNLSSKAICKLNCFSCWCVTGTPIQNTIDDLYGQFIQLKYQPWCDWQIWKELVLDQLKSQNYEQTLDILVQLIKPIMIRRLKRSQEVDFWFQEITSEEIEIELNEKEKRIYNQKISQLEEHNEKQESFNQMAKSHIFETIIWLRQICDHQSVIGFNKKTKDQESILVDAANFVNKKWVEKKIKNSEEKTLCQIQQRINDITYCVICMEDFNFKTLTVCTHIFCWNCIRIQVDMNECCPLCNQELLTEDLFTFPMGTNQFNEIQHSTKTEKVIEIIQSQNKADKIIVFSHFVFFLQILEKFLKEENIKSLVKQKDTWRITGQQQIKNT